jgi:hypothetical protein
VRETGYDWISGRAWTVGAPGGQQRRPHHRLRRGRRRLAFLPIAIAAAATATSILALSGVAATSPALYPCAGVPADAPQKLYPEKRYFLETQAWWSPMPGHSPDEPFQERTGHMHVGTCVPLYQTVSGGKLHLDMKWQLHMMQGVNGQGAPLPLSFIVYVEQLTKGVNLRNLGLWKGDACTTMQCDGWVSVDFDYSDAPSGWGNLNAFIQSFFTDGRQMRTLNHWPVNFQTANSPAPAGTPGVLSPSAYTGGESWFTQAEGGSAYARSIVQRPELEKLWNPATGTLVPKTGSFHITISGEKDGNRAMIDPAMHAMPPVIGTVLVDEPAGTAGKLYKSYDLTIDTTKLTNGIHKLVFQNIYKRNAGDQSGLIVLPFLVANPTTPVTTTTSTTTTTPPPTTSTSTTTTTTTVPPPPTTTTTTPPPYHPKCEPKCDEQLAEVSKQLADERAANADLRGRIERAKKELTG